MEKRPLSSLNLENASEILYLYENGLNQDFRGNTGLKQPQNPKLKFMGAQAFSATC